MKLKLIKILILASILVVPIFPMVTRLAVAQEASVLGASKIVFDTQLFIDGVEVIAPDQEIAAKSDQPSFSGYTTPDVSIALTINSVTIDRKVTSDSTGFWMYQLDKKLEAGKHTLKLNITDQSGKSSGQFLAATFTVPEVLGNSDVSNGVNFPTLYGLNYLTITILVFGLALFLALLYLLLRKYRSRDN